MTDAEKLLWSKLRSKQINGFQFYRQKIIGRYIADFYCPNKSWLLRLMAGSIIVRKGQERIGREMNIWGAWV